MSFSLTKFDGEDYTVANRMQKQKSRALPGLM
jgi:hypothetical protein